MRGSYRHLLYAAILWAVLIAIGEVLAQIDLFPTAGSTEADDFDSIFRYLMVVGVPVYTFVLAALFYAFLRFRTRSPEDDAPTIRGTGAAPRIWLGVTAAITLAVMIHPGLTGLANLRKVGTDYGFGEAVEADALVIDVTAFRWAWSIKYEESGLVQNSTRGEIVLPVDRQVLFRINATDVLHSFWIPAFRMKIDAVPGRTTQLSVTPNRLGTFAGDSAYRLQCAELCGLDHGRMTMRVRVVEEAEFESWLKQAGQ